MRNDHDKGLYSYIGTMIQNVRSGQRMTQEDLAAKVQRTRVSIANIEGGYQRLPISLLYEIALALDVPPKSLLTNTLDDVVVTLSVALARIADLERELALAKSKGEK